MSISGGGLSKSYSSSSTLDLEYETLNSSRSSNIFRAIIAIDSKLGKAVYTFMGVGKRYYFLNSNGLISHVSGSGFDVEVVPARRFYYGFDAGFATGLVTTLGAQLETTSYMLDGSLCVGYIRQMSKSIAFDAQLGMGMAYGFTGASATAQTQRILLGMIYSF